MNFNFTDATRLSLKAAREESLRLFHDYVGTEHVLLGVIKAGAWPEPLRELGVDSDAVVLRVQQSVRKGREHPNPKGELPYTSRAKKVLEFAMAEAKLVDSAWVEPSHLLLGVLREDKGIGCQVLSSLGLTTDIARQKLWTGPRDSTPTNEPGRRPRRRSPRSLFNLSIDDSSPSSIYEQIIAQVQEAVATGALDPGERLPTVRRLADELDIAPGTVARAYAELEQLGVVRSEGARGTRVAERAPRGQPAGERRDTLIGLLRPVAVAAFHLGATAAELRAALERAMEGVLHEDERA